MTSEKKQRPPKKESQQVLEAQWRLDRAVIRDEPKEVIDRLREELKALRDGQG